MRIVGGTHKGRRIRVPKKGIRPTKGIVRGAIFNIIGSYVQNAHILDIFAGSGALGLEAMSRGAKNCVFIERKPKFLIENIKNFLPLTQTVQVISCDFRQGLKKVDGRQFDIIFIDPPYQKNYTQKAVGLISKHHLLMDSGIVVVEHHSEEEFTMPEDFSLQKKKKYGETTVSFISKKVTHTHS